MDYQLPIPAHDDERVAHLRRAGRLRRGLVAGAAAASLAVAGAVGVAAAGSTPSATGASTASTSGAVSTTSTHGTTVSLGTGSGSTHASTAGS